MAPHGRPFHIIDSNGRSRVWLIEGSSRRYIFMSHNPAILRRKTLFGRLRLAKENGTMMRYHLDNFENQYSAAVRTGF